MARQLLPWLGLALRLGAAGIWLAAGAAKLADLQQFHAQVRAYELLPGGLEAPFAYGLPFAEIAVGLYLAIGLLVRPAALVATLLMVSFVVAMAQARARGLSIDCGCFGSAVRQQIGLGTIARDAALGVPTLILLLRPTRFASLDRRLLGRPDRFTLA